MKPTAQLHEMGQSLWLDDITRDLLDSGTLQRYINELSVTGLTSNPTIFDHAITHSPKYDDDIRRLMKSGQAGESVFFELALSDLARAADMFLPEHKRTCGVDGWVSLEVSPLLAHDTDKTVAEAKRLHDRAGKPNLFIKIPGTLEGLPAIEDSIHAGVSVNVTLLFSRAQYLAAADAYMRGLERRLVEGKTLDVSSVASVFISRWDRAVVEKVPGALRDKLGVAVGQQVYKTYRDLMDSDRWQILASHGARPQRLLFASTSMKDPQAPDTLYVTSLAAPNTVNTMPGPTLLAFSEHGEMKGVLSRDGEDSEQVLAAHVRAGIDVDALASKLQTDGASSFVDSWKDLLGAIDKKTSALAA
jgi:transaldolase